MGYSRDYLGSITVKSGVIELKDPHHPIGEANQTAGLHGALSDEGFAAIAKAVYVGTVYRDGQYPVFGHRNDNGELASVEIMLDEPDSES